MASYFYTGNHPGNEFLYPQKVSSLLHRLIDKLNSRLSIARNKLLAETIDDDEYIEIKKDCKEQIEKLKIQLNILPEQSKVDIPKLIDQAIESLTNIWKMYSEGGIAVKRKIIGSIFPEKLEFDGNHYRTTRINTIVNLIFQINNELPKKENRRNDNTNHFSCYVVNPKQISNQMLDDLVILQKIINIY